MIERLLIAAPDLRADALSAALAAELPTVRAEPLTAAVPARAVVIDLPLFAAPSADPAMIDGDVDAAAARGSFDLCVRGGCADPIAAVLAVLTRCQRHLGRTNEASRDPVWARLLARHRSWHALDAPLVKADLAHALDTWQWVLRLDPEAGLAVQAAALFHDVERLGSESAARTEHRAPDYDAFKEAHAAKGAALTAAALVAAGAPRAVVERASSLVAHHERPGDDPDLTLLNEADALSFFSLNSGGFVDCYGLDHAGMKVRRSLARLGPRGRARLAGIRCRPDVGALLRRALGEAA